MAAPTYLVDIRSDSVDERDGHDTSDTTRLLPSGPPILPGELSPASDAAATAAAAAQATSNARGRRRSAGDIMDDMPWGADTGTSLGSHGGHDSTNTSYDDDVHDLLSLRQVHPVGQFQLPASPTPPSVAPETVTAAPSAHASVPAPQPDSQAKVPPRGKSRTQPNSSSKGASDTTSAAAAAGSTATPAQMLRQNSAIRIQAVARGHSSRKVRLGVCVIVCMHVACA